MLCSFGWHCFNIRHWLLFCMCAAMHTVPVHFIRCIDGEIRKLQHKTITVQRESVWVPIPNIHEYHVANNRKTNSSQNFHSIHLYCLPQLLSRVIILKRRNVLRVVTAIHPFMASFDDKNYKCLHFNANWNSYSFQIRLLSIKPIPPPPLPPLTRK